MKTLDVWITYKLTGETVKITLPVVDLKATVCEAFAGVSDDTPTSSLFQQFKLERVSDTSVLRVYQNDIFDASYLNDLMRYVNVTYKGNEDIYSAFITIQHATGYDIKNAFETLKAEEFEFFPDVMDMEDLAFLFVQLNRIFKVKVPKELRLFLDYKKIGENMAANGHFEITMNGIIWFKQDVTLLQERESTYDNENSTY